MHSRQSGAAHVPIMFFLILMVMFLGALGFAWVNVQESEKIKAENVQIKADIEKARAGQVLRDHYIEDLGKIVNLPGTYEGRTVGREAYKDAKLDGVAGVVNLTALRERFNGFADAIETPKLDGVQPLLDASIAKFNALKQRIADLTTESENRLNEKNAVDGRFASAGQAHTEAQRRLSDQLNQTRNDLTNQVNAKNSNLENVSNTLRTKEAEFSASREEWTKDKKGLQNHINTVEAQNAALVSKISLVNPADQADGKVIAARNHVNSAFINLGRKDMLQSGVIFRIKNPGSDKVKGYATVTRVEQERAEVSLEGIVDPIGDSIREGDELFNELYTPGLSRNIYFMGRFSYPYNQGRLEALLKSLGNKIHNKMEPGVDLVILGNDSLTAEGDGFTPITDTAAYKEALNLGVEFAPLAKIRDLIKL